LVLTNQFQCPNNVIFKDSIRPKDEIIHGEDAFEPARLIYHRQTAYSLLGHDGQGMTDVILGCASSRIPVHDLAHW
jgi:hypothetical protein